MIKPSELREFSPEELESEVHRLEEEFFSLNFKHKTQPLSNPLKLRSLRRDIARALTIQNEKKVRG